MMASLAELTDNPFVQNTIDSVALRDATDLPKTRIIVRPEFVKENEPVKQDDSKLQNIIDKLFGLNGQERYQLWPEFTNRAFGSDLEIYKDGEKPANGLIDLAQQAHLLPSNKYNVFKDLSTFVKDPATGVANDIRSIRRLAKGFADSIVSGVTAPQDAIQGKIPAYQIDENGNIKPSDEIIHRAMDMAGLAGSGGLAGAGSEAGVALGSAPFLRPALKYGEKLYKGKPGQQHMDVIPADLYPTFQKQAMSGEDISNFNFGFLNHKGQFLSREDALKYAIDNGLVDPHSAQYGALTSTLMSDSAKPGAALAAVANTNKPFYSAVENAVAAAKQPKADAQQWLSFLKNQPGVKQEELAHLGLDKLSGSITKDDLLKAVQEGQPQIKEVVKADKINIDPTVKYLHESMGPATKHLKTAADIADARRFNSSFRETTKGMSDEDVLKAARKSEEYEGIGDSKFHSYQLPGGENYREMLLTLPRKEITTNDVSQKLFKRDMRNLDESERQAVSDEMRRLYETKEGGVDYKSSHWDEPNVLAHIRMNDRTIDGKKSLHLEEIQSDWHQAGRKRGYKEGVKEIKGVHPDDLKIEQGEHDFGAIAPDGRKARVGKGVVSNEQEARDYLARYLNKTAAEHNSNARIAEVDKVPDAPFKKTWDELALKKAITEAVKNGYDQISWTPGEAQAARYDLSKQVDRIEVPIINKDGSRSVRIDKNGGGSFKLTVDKNGIVEGHGGSSSQFSGKPLSDVVGKEMAEKLMNVEKNSKPYEPITELPKEFSLIRDRNGAAKGEEWGIVTDGQIHARSATGRYHATQKEAKDEMLRQINSNEKLRHDEANRTFEGDGLKVGGQGMKAFYDKMLVDKMNALTKKYGGKVEQKDLASGKRKTLDEISNDLGFGGWHSNLTETQKSKIMSVFDEQKPQREGKTKVHVLKITPELREQVLKKGFPLFSAGVPVFTPVDHNPFKEMNK